MPNWRAGVLVYSAVAATAGLVLLLLGPVERPPEPATVAERATESSGNAVAPADTPIQEAPPDSLAQELVASGWTREAAEAVARFHRENLIELRANESDRYGLTVARLKLLKNRESVAVGDALARHPELAGLLASIDDPLALAAVLTVPDGELLTTLFLTNCEPADANLLAAVLTGDRGKDGSRVAAMTRAGVVGAEAAFALGYSLRDGAERPNEAFLWWLRGAVDVSLDRPEELTDVYLFVLEGGEALRNRFDVPEFRERSDRRWALLARIARDWRQREGHKLGAAADPADLPGIGELAGRPGAWEFADHPRASDLFERHEVLAVDAFGAWAGAPDRRSRLTELMLSPQWGRACDALLALLLANPAAQHWKTLDPFLAHADVSAELLERVAKDVLRAGDARPWERLGQRGDELNQHGVQKLRAKLDPNAGDGWLVEALPGYALYRLYDKYSNEEEIDNVDLLYAGLDLVTLAPGAGLVVKIPKEGGKEALKQTGKEGLKRAATASVKRLGRNAAKAGAVAGNRAAFWAAARVGYYKLRTAVVRVVKFVALDQPGAVTAARASVEITPLVRFAYNCCRLGRDTFKRLTGLEARVFMRADARVYLEFHYKLTGVQVRAWIARLLQRALGLEEQEPAAVVAKPAPKRPPGPRPVQKPHPRDRQVTGLLFLLALSDALASIQGDRP